MTFLIILFIICIIVLIYCFYNLYRNNKVYEFRLTIIDAQFKYNQSINYQCKWNINTIPSYNKMLYQFWKPLKLRYWLTTEQIHNIQNFIEF